MSSWRGQAVFFCHQWGPGPGLVVMNACWKNVQTQSNWPTVFKRVTWSLCLVGRVKWWWSVWSWCWDRAPGVHCVVSPCEDLNSCLGCWCFFYNFFPTLFLRKEISKILKSSYLRAMNLASFFAVSKIMIFVTFITNELLDNRITASQVFVVVMLFEALRFSSTLYFPMAIEKVSEAVVSIQRIKVWGQIIFFQL